MARRQPQSLAVRARALARPALIPCLPTPYADELLSSWLARCAVSHRLDGPRSFADGVLQAEGMRALPEKIDDLDTQAPQTLITALARRTAPSEQELRRMMVRKGPNVLFQRHRDAYCPRCYQEDLERRAVYRRRRWIDSWCVQCETHGCLLGSYVHPTPDRKAEPLPIDEQLRLGVERLGTVVFFDPRRFFSVHARPVTRAVSRPRWLDPTMLSSPLGRSLMLLCGSTVGEHLEQKVFGDFARKKGDRWFDLHGEPIDWPDTQHPWSSIIPRVRAAYIASVCWRAVDRGLDVPLDTRAWLQRLSTRDPCGRGRKRQSGWRAFIDPDWRDTSEEDALYQEASALLRLRGTRYFNEIARRVVEQL